MRKMEELLLKHDGDPPDHVHHDQARPCRRSTTAATSPNKLPCATSSPRTSGSSCTVTGALLVLLVLSNTFLSKLCFAVVVGNDEKEDFLDTDDFRHIDVGGERGSRDSKNARNEKIRYASIHGARPVQQPDVVSTSTHRAQQLLPPSSGDRSRSGSSLVQKTSVETRGKKRWIPNPFEHIHVPDLLSHLDPFQPDDQTEEGKKMAAEAFSGIAMKEKLSEDPLDPDGLHSAWDTFYDSFLSAQHENNEGVEGVEWDADGDYPVAIFDTNGDGAVSKADFDAVDTNHDGRVDEGEFLQQQKIMENRFEAVDRFENFDEDKQEMILSRDAQDDQPITGILDTNHDGKFDARDQVPTDPEERKEFLKQIEKLAQHHQNRQDAIDAIEALDKDHNDKVDKDELRQAELMPSQFNALGLKDADDMMAKLDDNNDGEFDKTDVVAMKNEKILDALNHEQSMDDIHKALAQQGPAGMTSPLTGQLDMDGNGKVDDNELALADTDHDHMLDTKELEKASLYRDNLDVNQDGIIDEKDGITDHVKEQNLRNADARTVSYHAFRAYGWLRPEVGSDLWRVLDEDNDNDIQEDEFEKFAGKDGIMDMHDWKAVQEQAEELHKHDVDQYHADMRNHAVQTGIATAALYGASKLHQKRKAGQTQERIRAKEKQDAHQREEEDKARVRNSAMGKREALLAAQKEKKVGEENRLEQEKLQKLKDEAAQRAKEQQEAEAEWKRQQEQEEKERAEAEKAAQQEADAILQQIQTAVDENNNAGAGGAPSSAPGGDQLKPVPAAEHQLQLHNQQAAHGPQSKPFGHPAAAQLQPVPGSGDPLNEATNASPSHNGPAQQQAAISNKVATRGGLDDTNTAPGDDVSYTLRAAIAKAALAEQKRAKDAAAQQASAQHVTPFEHAHTGEVNAAQTTPAQLGHHDEHFPQTPPMADTQLLPRHAVPKDQRLGGGDEKLVSGGQKQEAAQQAQSTQQQQQLQALHEQYPGYSTTYLKKMLRQQKLQNPLGQEEKLQAAQQLQQLQQAKSFSSSSSVTPTEAKRLLGLSATNADEQQGESELQQQPSSSVDDPFVMQMNHADKEKMQQRELERQQVMQEKLKQHILLQQQQRQQREQQDAAEQNSVAAQQSQLRALQLAKEKAQQKALETARQAHWENLQDAEAARDHEQPLPPAENTNPALEIGVGKPITNPTLPETAKEKWLSDLLQHKTSGDENPTLHLNATGNGAVLAGVGGGGLKQASSTSSSSFLATSSSTSSTFEDGQHVTNTAGTGTDETSQDGAAPDENGFLIAPVVSRKEVADPELEDSDLDVLVESLSFLQDGVAEHGNSVAVPQQEQQQKNVEHHNQEPQIEPAKQDTSSSTATRASSADDEISRTTTSSSRRHSQGAGRGKGRKGVDYQKGKDYSRNSGKEEGDEHHANIKDQESKPLVEWYKDGATNLIWFKDWTIAPFQRSPSADSTHLIETWWAGSAERRTWTKFEYDTVTQALFEKETEPAVFGAEAEATGAAVEQNYQQGTTKKYNLRGTSKLKAKAATASVETVVPLDVDDGTLKSPADHEDAAPEATTAAAVVLHSSTTSKPPMANHQTTTTHMNLRGSTKKMLEEQTKKQELQNKNLKKYGQAQEHVLTDEATMTISPKEEDVVEGTDGAQLRLHDDHQHVEDHDYHYEKTYIQPLQHDSSTSHKDGEGHDEHEHISLYEKYGTEELLTMVIYCTILFLLAYFCLQKREQTRLQELLQMKNHPGRYADVGLGGGRASDDKFLADESRGRSRNDYKLHDKGTTRTNSTRLTCGNIMETSLNFLCGKTRTRSKGEDEDPRQLRRHESRRRNHSSVVRDRGDEATSPAQNKNYMQYARSRSSASRTGRGPGGPVLKMTGKRSKMWLQFEEDKLEYTDPNLMNTNQRDNQYGVWCYQETDFAHHADAHAAGINEITTMATTGKTNESYLQHQ
ncbi:unnamed protein product [Amoebophrya sp. A120]|nr:unnamed protein product [Amoebophrya sp. A120]|eukprot:GSA120T00021100001.1